jgi:YVTN family beta-propeller protein
MADDWFGPYRLDALLGRGGMGEVYRAFDTEHERVVALKRLAPHLADDPDFRARFKQEARLAARLRNPHIITIHRFGELAGHLFIDMRYVEGFDAADLVKAVGPLAPHRTVALVEQVASALDTAHGAGLVHRDVKPSNLLLDREVSQQLGDFIYLADFGITRSSSSTRSYSLTRTGALLGSLDYMAPEQFDGVVDKRVDIYALTCVFFELLTGKKPYHGAGLPALMHAHMNVAPPEPSGVNADLGTAFDDVISRGMAKNPVDRFHSAGELATAARAVLAGVDPSSAEHEGSDVGAGTSQRARDAEYAFVIEQKQRERIEFSGRHVLIEDEFPDDEEETDRRDGVAGNAPAAATGTVTDLGDSVTEQHAQGTAGEDVDTPWNAPEDDPDSVGEPPGGPDRSEESTIGGSSARAAAPLMTPDAPLEAIIVEHARLPTSRDKQGRNRVVLTVLTVVAVLVLVVAVANPFSSNEGPGGDAGVGPATVAPQAAVPAEPAAPTVAASTGSPTVRTVLKVGQSPQGIAVSPDGSMIFVANVESRFLSVINMVTPPLSATIPMPGTPRYVAVSPDGHRAYVGMYTGDGADSAVAVVDTASKAVSSVVASGPQPYALATGPNGDVFVPNHGASDVSILDSANLKFGPAVTVQPNPHGVAFAPSINRAYTANHESNSVSVIDLASNTVVDTIPVGHSPHSVAVSPDGRLLAAANYADAAVTFINTATNKVTGTNPAGTTPQHLAFAADSRHLYVVNEDADAISTIDPSTGAIVSTTAVGKSPRYVAASPDGRAIYVSNGDDGTVSVLDASGS